MEAMGHGFEKTYYPEKEKTGARGCAPVYINGIRVGNHPITMRRVVGKRKIAILGRDYNRKKLSKKGLSFDQPPFPVNKEGRWPKICFGLR